MPITISEGPNICHWICAHTVTSTDRNVTISTIFMFILFYLAQLIESDIQFPPQRNQNKRLKLVTSIMFLHYPCNQWEIKIKFKNFTFQRSHWFQLTNSGTKSVLNRSNSVPPLFNPSAACPKYSPTFTLTSFKSNPVSFFTDSPKLDQNCSEPRRIDRVRLTHENPSEPFGFAEALTRKFGFFREILGLCFVGRLKLYSTALGDNWVSGVEEQRSGFGL